MAKKKLTTEAADVIVKLATSQGWDCQWIVGDWPISVAVERTGKSKSILQSRKRSLLLMAKVLVEHSDIYEPEPPTARAWRKTGYVAMLLGLTTAQLTSLVYRAGSLGLTKPNLRTGKARWSELDIVCWLQYQKEGRLPLRK